MGRYINSEAVIIRLRGKVKTTSDAEAEPDRMPLLLLNRLINESEGSVEQDLSTRYFAPFQTISGGSFSDLPERPTKEILRTLCELLSVIRVLETDFGRGSGLDGMKYADSCQKRYDTMLYGDDRKPGIISLRENTYNTFRNPPLPGLKSNYQVSQADNGFSGFMENPSNGTGAMGYAAEQINDPAEDLWSGHINEGNGHHRGDL